MHPLHGVRRLFEGLGQVDQALDQAVRQLTWTPAVPRFAVAFPQVNLWEDAENVYAEAELPGVPSDNLSVVVSGERELTLEGERTPPVNGGVVWHQRERGFGRFRRVLALPAAVQADQVAARFQDGVLRLTLPKTAAFRARRIEVKSE